MELNLGLTYLVGSAATCLAGVLAALQGLRKRVVLPQALIVAALVLPVCLLAAQLLKLYAHTFYGVAVTDYPSTRSCLQSINQK